MTVPPNPLIEQLGPKRAKWLLALAAIVLIAIIVGFAGLILVDALQSGRRTWAGAIAALTVVAILLWLRIVWTQWVSLRIETNTVNVDNDDTGIWGVGGPNVRSPGATGMFKMPRRRSTDRRDDL